MLVTVMGVLVVVALIVLLLTEKPSVPVALISLPVIGALILGYSLPEIAKWTSDGLKSAAPNTTLAILGITFFAMMNDLGMFDPIVNSVTKHIGNSVIMAFVICWVVAVISTLDGASPSTILVTAPTMYPIFKKMKIRPVNLAFIITVVVGVFQYLPYSGMTLAAAVAMQTDAGDLWANLIPCFIFGLVLSFVVTLIFAVLEGKRIAAGKNDYLAEVADTAEVKTVELSDYHKKTRIFNIILTVALLAVLLSNKLNSVMAFFIAFCLAVVVNFPNVKQQSGVFRKYAPMCMFVVITYLTAGAYGTIMSSSGMMNAMVEALLSIFPESIGAHVPFIMGVFGVPLGFFLGGAAYYNGLMPVLGGMAAGYGISNLSYCGTMMVGKGIGMLCSPTTPNLYLMTDMCKVSAKEYFKQAFIPLWLISIVVLIFGCITGCCCF